MSRTISKGWRRSRPPRKNGALLHFRVVKDESVIWQNGTIPKGELLTLKADNRFALVGRWISAGVIARESNPVAGMCRECKCTWSKACPGGCSWTDDARTLCSKCERKGLGQK